MATGAVVYQHEKLTVLGRAGVPPYQAERAFQTGSGSISKSRPRINILSRFSRPPSLVSIIIWKKRKSFRVKYSQRTLYGNGETKCMHDAINQGSLMETVINSGKKI